MKKLLLLAVSGVFVLGVSAQDKLTAKNGAVVLPEAGDWSLSLNAAPITRFMGNMFNGNLNNNANPFRAASTTGAGNSLLIRKFTTDKQAMRAFVGFNFNSAKGSNDVADDKQTTAVVFPALPDMVTDETKVSNTNIMLGVGQEWRKGERRLQGFYGGDVMLTFSGNKRTNTWGNTMSDTGIAAAGTTITPMSTTWAGTTATGSSAMGTRTISTKSGTTFGFGVRGFIGADFFILPKFSIGFEYGWGISLSTTGQGTTVTETTGGAPNKRAEQETTTGKRSSFGVANDINSGQFRLSVFF